MEWHVLIYYCHEIMSTGGSLPAGSINSPSMGEHSSYQLKLKRQLMVSYTLLYSVFVNLCRVHVG